MQDTKIYLYVPYSQKDEAKLLGAKWDSTKKQWYAPADIDITLFAKWQTQTDNSKPPALIKGKTKPRTAGKNILLGVKTYGNNKDLKMSSDNSPPWD